MSTAYTKERELEEFFTPKELAEHLNVSERTVRELIGRRVIASYRVGGARRIARTDLDAYLVGQRDERVAR